MKILTVCPTIHFDKFRVMYNSWELTRSKESELRVSSNIGVTDSINQIFHENPNYDFYHITNDDVEYKTPLWDLKLAQKGKISYGNDGFQGSNLCTFPMIDGNIVRALGWLQLPTLDRYAGDVVWKFIGESCKCLQYVPEVEITHLWEGCADVKQNTKDMSAFAQWLPWAFKDMQRVKAVLNEK